ncbi:unnamed protein product [Leuciscus chuanchicus]
MWTQLVFQNFLETSFDTHFCESRSRASVTDGWPEVWIFAKPLSLSLTLQDCYIFTAKTSPKTVGWTLKTEKQLNLASTHVVCYRKSLGGDPGDDRHDISSEEVLTDPELDRHEGFQDEGEGKLGAAVDLFTSAWHSRSAPLHDEQWRY